MQSVRVLLGGFDQCCELDCLACVAHQLGGERGVDVSGSQVVAAGVKRFGCSPAVESFLHRALDPSAGVRQRAPSLTRPATPTSFRHRSKLRTRARSSRSRTASTARHPVQRGSGSSSKALSRRQATASTDSPAASWTATINPQTPRHAQRRCEQSAAGCARPEAFRLQSCRGVVSSSRRRSLCRCSPDCEFTGMMAQPLNGPSLRSRDSNDYSAAVQRCLSAERLVRGMKRASPLGGKRHLNLFPDDLGRIADAFDHAATDWPRTGWLVSRCRPSKKCLKLAFFVPSVGFEPTLDGF